MLTTPLHPSTLLCLEAMEKLQSQVEVSNSLDLGCGGGLLSVIAARTWGGRVLAADISPNAVRDAKQYVLDQGLDDLITVIRSDGCSAPEIAERAPYDLMLCNLLAELLRREAPNLLKYMVKNGLAVLSGILEWQAAETQALYTGLGFEIIDKITTSPWVCLVIRKPL